MKLILGYGGGSGYYPYTQKPVDYQPYRPVYLFRGPPPDAGFSYGLFEDEVVQKKYYADMGLEPFSPFSGKPAKLLEELTPDQLARTLGDDLKKGNLEEIECLYCASKYLQNLRSENKGRELWCHHCGGKLPMIEHPKTPEPKPQEADSEVAIDPRVKKFIDHGLETMVKSLEMKELIERLAHEKNIDKEKAKKEVLRALSDALRGKK